MSDFPEGIAAPEGAQKLVDVCKETWAVIQDESSEVTGHDEAVESFEDAMDELAELQKTPSYQHCRAAMDELAIFATAM